MKRKIITYFILFYILLSTCSFGFFSTFPIWTEQSDTIEVNSDVADNFLNLESESAILIEQTTRKSFI